MKVSTSSGAARDVVAATLIPPPKKLGVTHWSTWLLSRHLGIRDATVARA